MPSGHSLNGRHTALDPTPIASLAPTAEYTMFEPAGGGPLGATGLSLLNSLLHPVTDTPRTSNAIRKIGEGRLTREKVAIRAKHEPRDRH
jgi:hypothetical protein